MFFVYAEEDGRSVTVGIVQHPGEVPAGRRAVEGYSTFAQALDALGRLGVCWLPGDGSRWGVIWSGEGFSLDEEDQITKAVQRANLEQEEQGGGSGTHSPDSPSGLTQRVDTSQGATSADRTSGTGTALPGSAQSARPDDAL